MTLVTTKSLQDWINIQLQKWRSLEPDINTNSDTMVYMDSAVVAEILYLLQGDLVTLTNNAFLAYATGDELSNLGKDRGIPRLVATLASWIVTFGRWTKSSSNYSIPTGTMISTQVAWPNSTVISFITTEDVVLYWTVWIPGIPSYTTQTSGGLIENWVYSYKITAIAGDDIETDAWPNRDVTITNGLTTNTISLTWTAVPNAVAYNVYIYDWVNYVLLHQTVSANYIDTVWDSINIQTPPATNETWNLEVNANISAIIGWAFGNVAPNTIINFITKPVWIEYVYNALETSWGSDDESDDEYRERIANQLSLNTGKVTKLWYEQTCSAVPWVATSSLVIPVGWQYRNNIEIIITSDSGSGIPTQTLIDTVQATVTRDENRAPCDNILVRWPDITDIDYTTTIVDYDHWYSQAYLISAISDNVSAYLRSVPVWEIVYMVGIANAIHDTLGVIDYILDLPNVNIQLAPWYMWVAGNVTINFI